MQPIRKSTHSTVTERSPLFVVDPPRPNKEDESPMFQTTNARFSVYGSTTKAPERPSRTFNIDFDQPYPTRIEAHAIANPPPTTVYPPPPSLHSHEHQSLAHDFGWDSTRAYIVQEEQLRDRTRKVSFRTRQPPQTRLESLGSSHTWLVLLLPAFIALLALFLHPTCLTSTGNCNCNCL